MIANYADQSVYITTIEFGMKYGRAALGVADTIDMNTVTVEDDRDPFADAI